MTDSLMFLEACLRDVPSRLFFYLWTLPQRRSRWYPASEEGTRAASSLVEEAVDRMDFYVGVALSETDRGYNRRVTAAEAAGVFGLWADVDYHSDDERIHKKPNLPPDEATARDLLLEALPRPTLIVHSGHGLQGWWLLEQPWIFDDVPGEGAEEQRALAADLAQRWNQRLQTAAEAAGWAVDSVHDLSRVLRLPGTINHKADPVPVRLLDVTGERFSLENLREIAGAPKSTEARVHTSVNVDQFVRDVGPFELRGDAAPPFHKWEALKGAEPRAARSWSRSRRDLADQSPSGYDLSLAAIAAMASWTDQEIVDLLVAARIHNAEDPKLDRPDYYARTLMRARETSARAVATEDLEHSVDHFQRAPTEEQRGEAREQALDQASASLGVRIIDVIRYTQDPPRYKLVTPSGATTMDASTILNANRFRAKIAEATSIVVQRFKGPAWDKIAQALFTVAMDVDTGAESTELGAVRSWVSDYLLDNPPQAERDEVTVQMQAPFRDAGRVFIFGAAFRRWLALVRGERINAQQMGMMLRTMGAEPVTVMLTFEGRRTSRSVWRLPRDLS